MKTIKKLITGFVVASQLFATSADAFDLSSIVHVDQNTKHMIGNLQFLASGGKVSSLDQINPSTLDKCSAGTESYNPANQMQAQAFITRFKEVTAKYRAAKSLTPDQALEVTCAALPMLRYMEQVDRQQQGSQANAALKSVSGQAVAMEKPLPSMQQAANQGKLPPKSVQALNTSEAKAQSTNELIAVAQQRDLVNTDSDALIAATQDNMKALQNALASPALLSYYTAAYRSYVTPDGTVRPTPQKPDICFPNDPRLIGIRWACSMEEFSSIFGGKFSLSRKVTARKAVQSWNQVSVPTKDYGLIKNLFSDASKGFANKAVDGLDHVLLPLIKSPGVDAALHAMPLLGNGLSMIEALTGKDWLTGQTLDPASRLVSLIGIIPEGNLAAGLLRNAGVTSELALNAARVVDFLGKPQVQMTAGVAASDTASSVYAMANDVTIGGVSVSQTLHSVASEAVSYVSSNPVSTSAAVTQATGNQTYSSMRVILGKMGAA